MRVDLFENLCSPLNTLTPGRLELKLTLSDDPLTYHVTCSFPCIHSHVLHSEVFFKIKLNVFFGYFDPKNIFLDNKNK